MKFGNILLSSRYRIKILGGSFKKNTDYLIPLNMTSLVAQTVKSCAYNAGDLGSIPGSGRSPGEGNGNPLQYSCLENRMD